MIPLPSQEFFESLLNPRNQSRDPLCIILFTATWCSPCGKLDKDYLANLPNIKWYKCEITENKYTPGYCGVGSIPAFLAIVNGQPQPLFVSSNTEKVEEWTRTLSKIT